MTWQEVLVWVFGGPGAGIIIYAALEEWGSKLSPKAKRYISIFGTIGLVAAAYGVSVWFGFVDNPPNTVKAWIEQVAPLALTALGMSQIIHGERQLTYKQNDNVTTT